MSTMASQITGVSILYSTVCSDADQRKHQSSVSLAFVSNAENVSIWWRHHAGFPLRCWWKCEEINTALTQWDRDKMVPILLATFNALPWNEFCVFWLSYHRVLSPWVQIDKNSTLVETVFWDPMKIIDGVSLESETAFRNSIKLSSNI